MDGLAVTQQDNPKIPVFHLRYLNPAAKPSIGMPILTNRRLYRPFDPRITNDAPIRTEVNCVKYAVVFTTDCGAHHRPSSVFPLCRGPAIVGRPQSAPWFEAARMREFGSLETPRARGSQPRAGYVPWSRHRRSARFYWGLWVRARARTTHSERSPSGGRPARRSLTSAPPGRGASPTRSPRRGPH